MERFLKAFCVCGAAYALWLVAYQVTQWHDEENRTPRVRVVLVLDSEKRPIEGAAVRMEGASFRPIFPVLSGFLQKGVWHPRWVSATKTTGKDGVATFTYKSDSARIAEIKIEDRSITKFGDYWYHADGTLEPYDVYLVPYRRRDEDEKDTVTIMKGGPNKPPEAMAVERPPSNPSPAPAMPHL